MELHFDGYQEMTILNPFEGIFSHFPSKRYARLLPKQPKIQIILETDNVRHNNYILYTESPRNSRF